MDGKSPIKEFYKGKNIFITGGTGFVGFALVEKLLRSTEPNKIYLLLREKKGKAVSERLEEYKKNSIFETLIKEKGTDVFSKLVAIAGDVGEENLGISEADRAVIVNNVNIVIHSAASLDFEADLKITVKINLLGTRRVVDLCKSIRNLNVLLHVSTAYVNSHMIKAEEKSYPMSADADKVIELVNSSTDEEIKQKTPSVLGEFINTYTFTKALAEKEVIAANSSFPTSIVRPSIIVAAWKEPVPGWTNSKNGPQGFIMGASKGVVRRLPTDPNLICDYIPIDTVVNGIIAAAWNAGTTRPSETPIFHATSSTYKPFRWNIIVPDIEELFEKEPLKGSVWYPHLKLLPSVFMFKLSAIIFHWLPAIILDTFTRICGQRPILIRMHTNINKSLAQLESFIFTEWMFYNKRTMQLHNSFTEADKQVFGLDLEDLVWSKFFESMASGVRRYLLNEKPETIPYAKKRTFVLKILNYIVQILFVFFVWTLITAVTSTTYSGTMFTVLPLIVLAFSML